MIRKALCFVAVSAMVTVGHAGIAQTTNDASGDASTLSAEELQKRFNNQRTRGLSIAPTTSGDAAVTATDDSAATTVAATEEYTQVPVEDQVAIQISFDFDSSALRADQKPKLATLCEAMQSFSEGGFRIVGHTDASGSASYNERLSLLRAEEVKRHLVSDCGISETRLEAVGVGEAFPLDGDDPNADANRRVEFQALS
ncbi:MAG: OmpA family protein [Pseudomonadota bacterium]